MNLNAYQKIQIKLANDPKIWLITGVAGFVGSNLLEKLLLLDQKVVGLDNFATGHQKNLDEVRDAVSKERWTRFSFIKGDIRKIEDCIRACDGINYVLHQAALGSVPRSLLDPISTNETNISGFLNMLVAAKDAKVESFTYAASSSTYGDHPGLPKVERKIGKPLSPYAVTKYVNEVYASVFATCYGFNSIGLRYFNVFGPRQDPKGVYAAVIPKWIEALLTKQPVFINGDGETSRDFCYIANAVQANILAATTLKASAKNQIYNVAVGCRTTLNDLFKLLRERALGNALNDKVYPVYLDTREGDIRHSQADISKAIKLLLYVPSHDLNLGLDETVTWYRHKIAYHYH